LSHEDGQAHGSGRSVPGFHLLDAITRANGATGGTAKTDGQGSGEEEKLFTRFGGHAHAVGFSLPSANVEELRQRMHLHAQGFDLSEQPPLECDAALPLSAIDDPLAGWLDRFAPFGMENNEPIFFVAGVRLVEAPKLLKQVHLKVLLEDPATGARRYALAWGRGAGWGETVERLGLRQGSMVDLAFRLRRNLHPDFGGLELEIAALRPAGEMV
jgi:single-stranded-DNA-specific exonuclease